LKFEEAPFGASSFSLRRVIGGYDAET
jgi:hypothetical protein